MDTDETSLFGSPPPSPKSQATQDIFARKDETPLFLPGVGFDLNASSVVPIAEPVQAQSSSSIPLQRPTSSWLPSKAPIKHNQHSQIRFQPQISTPVLGAGHDFFLTSFTEPSQETLHPGRHVVSASSPYSPSTCFPQTPQFTGIPEASLHENSTSSMTTTSRHMNPFTLSFPSAPGINSSSQHLSPSNHVDFPPESTLNSDSHSVLIPRGHKKCSKCNKVQPPSEFDHMDAMGRPKPRSQCATCREKRRVSSARSKLQKAQVKAAQEQELQQHPTEISHGVFAQPNGLSYGYMPIRNIPQPPPTQGFADSVPDVMETPPPPPTAVSCPDGLPSVATQSNISPSADASLNLWSFGTEAEGLDSYMAYYENSPLSPLQSPSSILPPENNLEDSQKQSEHGFNVISVKILPFPLSEEATSSFLDQEREKFGEARNKCPWMKGQDEATVERHWRRREASIILGLVEVPPPEPQPYIGFTHEEGSHEKVLDVYSDSQGQL